MIFDQKVPQRSDKSKNDHKSKGYPSETPAAVIAMQKQTMSDKFNKRQVVL